MGDKKKNKSWENEDEEPKVTKEEYAVAKYLRFGLPVREGKLHGMEVKCFIANAAIDKLLESNWSASKDKTDPIFTNRSSCIVYMNTLLEKGLFHRADRDKRKKDKECTKKKKKDKETEKKEVEKEEPSGDDELRQRKGKKEKKSKKDKDQTPTEKGKDDTDNKDEKKKEEKKKKERRLKLLMSEDQWFEDGDEVFVWIYDPVNIKTFMIGLLMVLGAIGLCMFPLWPEEVRLGVYYLSLAAAGFVGFILSLTVVRLILFCIVWALTLGKHHFWFLPNLTEDVGFFDSFRPLYKHDVMTKDSDSDSNRGKKKLKKKTGDQSDKESKKASEGSNDKDDSDEFEVIKEEDLDESKEEQEKNTENSADDDEEDNDVNEEENDLNDEENDLNEDDSEDYNEEEDIHNNSSSEKEDKKSK